MELAEYYGGMSPMQAKMAHLRSLRGGARSKQPSSYQACVKACKLSSGYVPRVLKKAPKKLVEAMARASSMGLDYPSYQALKKEESKARAKAKRGLVPRKPRAKKVYPLVPYDPAMALFQSSISRAPRLKKPTKAQMATFARVQQFLASQGL